MELYQKIRRAVMIDGMSRRWAATYFGINRKTVDKMLVFPEPPPHGRSGRTYSRKLAECTEIGASAENCRSSTLPAIIDRSPASLGKLRRRGRAFTARRRINRSTRCKPHDRPLAKRSCQTRRAP